MKLVPNVSNKFPKETNRVRFKKYICIVGCRLGSFGLVFEV